MGRARGVWPLVAQTVLWIKGGVRTRGLESDSKGFSTIRDHRCRLILPESQDDPAEWAKQPNNGKRCPEPILGFEFCLSEV